MNELLKIPPANLLILVGVSTTKPKTTIPMLEKVKIEMSKFVYDQYQKKFALEKQIEAASTEEDVNSVVW